MLKKISVPVTDFGDNTQRVIKDLLDTMANEPMAGLSAPQIGELVRIFVVDISPKSNDGNGTDGAEAFVNPEIIKKSEETFSWREGCVSIPGHRGEVKRFKNIILRYQDSFGHTKEREVMDYLSGCFQHEIDHLNGILWVDYQTAIKREFVRKKMIKLKTLPKEEQKWPRGPK